MFWEGAGEECYFLPLRTLLRLLDACFVGYLVGAIAVAATRRWQRLGDLLCGTLVVERRTLPPASVERA